MVMDCSITEDQFQSRIFSFTYQVVPFVIMEFSGADELFEQLFDADCSLSPYVKEVVMLILMNDPDYQLATSIRADNFDVFKSVVNNAICSVYDHGFCPGYFLRFCARLCFLALIFFSRGMEDAAAYVSLSLNLLLHRYHINNQFTDDSWLELDEEAKGVINMCKLYEPEEVIRSMGRVRFARSSVT